MTNFDLWILLQKFKIPSIFISTFTIMLSNNDENVFVAYAPEPEPEPTNSIMNDTFVFIICPALRNNIVPTYKLIVKDNSITFPINIFQKKEECINKIKKEINDKQNIEQYLSTYIPTKKIYKKKLVLIPDDATKKQKTKIVLKKTKKHRKMNKLVVIDEDDSEPAIVEPAIVEPAIVEPAIVEPAIVEPAIVEPAIVEPAIVEPAIVEPVSKPISVKAVSKSKAKSPSKKPRCPNGTRRNKKTGECE